MYLGLEVQTGVAKTGVVGILEGDADGTTILYCADMDVLMSGSSTFQIVVRGHGGHAALPHTTIDPVSCTGQLITALLTIVGRRMNAMDGAGVLSVTGLNTSSMRHNIIPETVEIMGTFRTFNAYTSELLEQHIRDVSRSVCESVCSRSFREASDDTTDE